MEPRDQEKQIRRKDQNRRTSTRGSFTTGIGVVYCIAVCHHVYIIIQNRLPCLPHRRDLRDRMAAIAGCVIAGSGFYVVTLTIIFPLLSAQMTFFCAVLYAWIRAYNCAAKLKKGGADGYMTFSRFTHGPSFVLHGHKVSACRRCL